MTGGDPHGGLAETLDDHLAAEFATRDVDITMATMTDDPYLNHVPVLTGGIGREEVRRFYEQIFIGHWPADIAMERISRTVGSDHVVDELVLSFTHDITMSHILPGVPPTGKRVQLAVCVVAGFRDGKLAHEHIYRDQASVLVQVGLLDPADLPAVGAQQAEKLLAPRGRQHHRRSQRRLRRHGSVAHDHDMGSRLWHIRGRTERTWSPRWPQRRADDVCSPSCRAIAVVPICSWRAGSATSSQADRPAVTATLPERRQLQPARSR